MTFKQANRLVRECQYEEAEKLYEELYANTQLDIYKSGIEYVRRKLKKPLITEKKNLEKFTNNRIIFITAGLKGPTAGGGIATTFHSMIKTISEEANTNVSVLYIAHPSYASGNHEQWKQYYKNECNAQLITVNINRKNYGSQEMLRSHAALEFLIETKGDFDTVVFHDYSGLAYYALLAQKYNYHLRNIRILISAHGNHTLSYHFGAKKINTWNEKAVMYMERISVTNADEVTTPSEYYAKWFDENFGNKNAVKLPNIVFNSMESKNKIEVDFINKSNQLIIFYGRMERLKGLDIFLDAVINNQKYGIKYNILFAGNNTKIDGVDAKDYIKSALKEYAGEFKFKLNCEASALYNYANENNGVCIFPTLGETSSCVVVESILSSVKFLASNIPAIKELISENRQEEYLFESGSVEALSNKLRQLPVRPDSSVLSLNMEENKKRWNDFLSKKEVKIIEKFTKLSDGELISVIIPTCDRPQLLVDSILSIMEQTYKNIEIIIVDDASVNYVENKLITTKLGVKYIHSSKKIFKGAACNLAAKQAKGKYICFFDDDDIAKPRMLENYIQGFQADDSVDIFSGFADVFEHSNLEETGQINVEYTSLALGGGLEVNLHINFFGKGTFIIKTDKFNEIGGYEIDTDCVPMVDYRFYIKSALHRLNISIIPTGQYYYRKNSPNSLFYLNKDKRNLQYHAKKSIEKIMENKLGHDIGKGFSSMIWDISIPKFN